MHLQPRSIFPCLHTHLAPQAYPNASKAMFTCDARLHVCMYRVRPWSRSRLNPYIACLRQVLVSTAVSGPHNIPLSICSHLTRTSSRTAQESLTGRDPRLPTSYSRLQTDMPRMLPMPPTPAAIDSRKPRISLAMFRWPSTDKPRRRVRCRMRYECFTGRARQCRWCR